MRLLRLSAAIVAVVLATATSWSATIRTASGPLEIFSRADLLDLVELLRLTGAQVEFSPAAGSYVAVLGEHEVQFTPGGSLAVVDGALVPLPGPIRALDAHVVGSPTTAVALLTPFGWTLRGSAPVFDLLRLAAGNRVELSVVQSPSGTLLVLRGIGAPPRVAAAAETVLLTFPGPVDLMPPVPLEGGLVAAEVQGNAIRLRLAPGLEVASTYPLDNPPRFVLRLGRAEPTVATAERLAGPVVVLDPGHGGEDRGAEGPGGELEKDIALAVARFAAARLQAAGIQTRLTREGDEAIALTDRTALANRLGATAFLSIHVNASPARAARGAETYFMNADASDLQAAQAADRENATAATDTLQLILWDLAYVANLNASARLARTVQERLNLLHGIEDRGVKQAPFVVLTGATMPAALVEIGFLSNPDEAARLSSRPIQEQLGAALADAVATFVRTPAVTPVPTP